MFVNHEIFILIVSTWSAKINCKNPFILASREIYIPQKLTRTWYIVSNAKMTDINSNMHCLSFYNQAHTHTLCCISKIKLILTLLWTHGKAYSCTKNNVFVYKNYFSLWPQLILLNNYYVELKLLQGNMYVNIKVNTDYICKWQKW